LNFLFAISPAHSAAEHAALYTTPPCPSTVVIYSGFGFKGRNVIAVRNADIVILVTGGIGTLNEFSITYDEGKVIGLLQGMGDAADSAQTALDTLPVRATGAVVIADPDDEQLVDRCMARLCAGRGEPVEPHLDVMTR
jgi:predicted Rossmann-fold nucleotide-binding protein